MVRIDKRHLKEATLRCISEAGRTSHKVNLIGRTFQRGTLELVLDVTFTPDQRAMAALVFDELKRDGYTQAQ